MPVYKNKERNTWYTSFYYTDWTGKRRKKKKEGFQKKSEALDFEREFINKQSGTVDMTFASMYEIYIKDCEGRVRESTLENKKNLIELKILPYFRDLPVNKITPGIVRQWQNELLQKKLSPTYLKTIHNQISAIMNYAVKYYNLPFNPAARAGSIGKNFAEQMDFWTRDEFEQFLTIVASKPASRVMFEMLFWTGMRRGELLALTLNDIDFIAKEIIINKSLARVKGNDIIGPPKTPKSTRKISVPDFLLDSIQDYISRLVDYDPAERIFEYTSHYLQAEMYRGCKKSGVKRIRIHDLRHSHASLLIELGFPILLVSERLGHENIETTLQTYGHLYPNKHAEVASVLQQIKSDSTFLVRQTENKTVEPL